MGKGRVVAHLTLVGTPAEYGETVPAPAAASDRTEAARSSAVSNALMYQAVSWVALMMERACLEVALTPLGGQFYEAAVALDGGDVVVLRVRLVLSMGRVLQSLIEPAHP